MSSFIVSEECMRNIINGLFWDHKLKTYQNSLYEEQGLNEFKDFLRLADKLYLLNQSAVMQRYPDDTSDYIQIPKYKHKDMKVSLVQFYKSVVCLHYQCCEGDAPEEKLFKWLDKLEIALARHIVMETEEYNKSRWG